MIVDPWGTVLAQAPDGPTVVTAEIDLDRVGDGAAPDPFAANRRADIFGSVW